MDLPFAGPLDAAAMLAFLAARAIPGIESVDGATYRRAGLAVEVRRDRVRMLEGDSATTRRLLGLDDDPRGPDAALRDDPLIGPLVRARPGLRVPGTVDGFELAVRAVAGQQVSVAGARTVLARLAASCGTLPRFPDPAAVLAAPDASFAMPAARRDTIRALASAVLAGTVVLDAPVADRPAAEAALLAVPGVGPWTVGYVALRAWRDRDAFEPADLGVRRALRARGAPDRPRDVAALAERWRPWRAHAQLHLWSAH